MIYLDSSALSRRLDPDVVPAARALVSQLDLIPPSGPPIEQAIDTGDPGLCTLDALHLASALSNRIELTAFVAYDHRLHAAAEAAGIAPNDRPTPARGNQISPTPCHGCRHWSTWNQRLEVITRPRC